MAKNSEIGCLPLQAKNNARHAVDVYNKIIPYLSHVLQAAETVQNTSVNLLRITKIVAHYTVQYGTINLTNSTNVKEKEIKAREIPKAKIYLNSERTCRFFSNAQIVAIVLMVPKKA